MKKRKQERRYFVSSAKLSEGVVALATSTERSEAEAQKGKLMEAFLNSLAHHLYRVD